MDFPVIVTQLVSELLAEKSPEYAARLKQRLAVVMSERGLGAFEERAYGFKGFRDFLKRGLTNVKLEESGDDLLVYSADVGKSVQPRAQVLSNIPQASTTIRSDVWQAFSNPDNSRHRFLNKKTYVIRHYIEGEDSAARSEVEAARGDFLEIKSITGEEQREWMRQFLTSASIKESERGVLEAIIALPYSSSMNAAFTQALGENSDAWRHFRTKHVTNYMSAWASTNGLNMEKLRLHQRSPAASNPKLSLKSDVAPREQVVRLLDLLSDAEISRIVLPILLTTMLVRSKS